MSSSATTRLSGRATSCESSTNGSAGPLEHAFLAAHPERQPEILGIHTIVRRSTPRHLKRDLLTLRRHPEFSVLHPGLEALLAGLAEDPSREAFYALPYSVA